MNRNTQLPKIGTKAAKDFYDSWKDINRLFNFILNLVGRSEHVAKTAHDALISVEEDPEKKSAMEESWSLRKGAVDELKANRQLLIETILVRHIENFINYLSAVLFEIFITRPETLKSSDKVDVAKILEHDSIESLVREIAETKVDSISYSSFSKMSEFFEERFKISLASKEDIQLLHEYIEIRNISVHNRCFINKRFIARTNLESNNLGKKKELFSEQLNILIPKLSEIVKATDRLVRRKMKVNGIRFSTK